MIEILSLPTQCSKANPVDSVDECGGIKGEKIRVLDCTGC